MTRPGDALEREADRLADQALRATADSPAATSTRAPAGTVMRQTSEPDERLREYEEDPLFDIPAASRSSTPPAPPSGFLSAVSSAGGGAPLAEPVRERMEQGFGRSFDGVRVHADSQSARLSDAINARAFVHGQDVFFDRGEYRPGTAEGDRLIAHELAHTVQQPGRGTVARDPQKKGGKKGAKKPLIDVTRLTDEQKIELRVELHEEAKTEIVDLRETFKQSPPPSAAAVAALKDHFDRAIASAKTDQDEEQRRARLAWLESHRRLLDDPFYAWGRVTGKIFFTGGDAVIDRVGDPLNPLNEDELAQAQAIGGLASAGADVYLTWIAEMRIYARKGIDPSDLETEETSAAEQKSGPGLAGGGSGAGGTTGPGGTPSGAGASPTVEQRQVLEELSAELGDLFEEDAPDYDRDALVKKLEGMTPEQRKDFYAYARKMIESQKGITGGQPKSLADLFELFHQLDPASREALTVNRELQEEEPGAEGLPDSVLLKLKEDATKSKGLAADAKKVTSNLDLIKSRLKDPDSKRLLDGLDLGIDAFVNEKTMLYGLLVGAGEESDLVKAVGDELITEIDEFQGRLEQRLAEAIGESVALAALTSWLPAAGPVVVGRMLVKVKQLKDLLDTLQRVYNIYNRIKRVIKIVADAGDAYTRFRTWFERATEVYAKLETQLERVDSSEELEAELEAQEEKLLDELDTQLNGNLGQLLEMMYIPEDTPPEELRRILFDIPKGTTLLQAMWDHYQTGDSSSEKFTDVLGIKAFAAGKRLYPLVGLMAALIGEQLQAAFPDRTVEDRINRLIPKSKRAPGLQGINRGLFGRLRPKNYEFKDSDLMPHLTAARDALRTAIDDDEPGTGASEHWAPGWFKLVLRREIKQVNTTRKGKTVPAERKTKGPTGVTKVREDVPLPPFRVRLKRQVLSRGKLEAVVKINPELPLDVDRLSSKDFAGSGVKYDGPEERKEAIRKWLGDEGYLITKDPNNREHIRLPDAKEATRDLPYLHYAADGHIKQDTDPDAWQAFKGKLIGDSNDLPEGYFLHHKAGTVYVRRKRGMKGKTAELGLDPNSHLVEGTGGAKPRVVRQTGIEKPRPGDLESFDYTGSLDAMFPATKKAGDPEYNLQNKKQRDTWKRHIDSNAELQKRPKKLKGDLGYTVNARAMSDLLGQRHIPELQTRDDKGHLVARRFGGVDDYANLVPMLRKQNQYPGKWFALEDDMADVYVGKAKAGQGHYVEFEATLTYPTPKTRRPSRFVARYQEKDAQGVNVGRAKSKTVDND